MPRKRFVNWEGRAWLLSDLARHGGLAVGTLSDRLDRFGDGPSGIARALATGLQSRSAAGRTGAARSPWALPVSRG
jgi:hypothetical protein